MPCFLSLYIQKSFLRADYLSSPNTGISRVAKWDGSNWTEVGLATGGLQANSTIVSVISDASGNLYAAGYFTNSDGYAYVAKWDKATDKWTEVGK